MIEEVDKVIKWLEANKQSENIVRISQVLNQLAILSSTVSQQVTEAYAVMNELEDNYDIAYAEETVKVMKEGNSAAGTKPIVEAKLAGTKKSFTSAKNIHKKLSMYLDRMDRIADFYKQYVSNLKIELKHQ